MAWDKVYASTLHGGLRIRCLDHFNNAYLAKLGWNILMDDDNWWVQLVRRRYLKQEDFMQNKIKQHYSLAWKGILNSRHILNKGNNMNCV